MAAPHQSWRREQPAQNCYNGWANIINYAARQTGGYHGRAAIDRVDKDGLRGPTAAASEVQGDRGRITIW